MKELFESDSGYAEVKKGLVFLTHSVVVIIMIIKLKVIGLIS